MKKLRNFYFCLGALVFALMNLCLLEPACAGTRTISVSPVKENVELKPGETYTGKLKIKNTGEEDYNFSIKVVPYQVTDYTYDAVDSVENSFTEITDWITVSPSSGRLAVGDAVEVYYTINVPYRAHGGGQYAMISAAIDSDDNISGSGINISGSVNEIIYAHVDGEINRSGEITDNTITGFTFNPPISATTIANNVGNIDNVLKSTISVYSFFSGKEVYTNKNNPAESTVLPETTRKVVTTWNDSPRLGIFRVSLTSEYLNETQNLEKVVIVCPLWLILVVIVAVVMLVLKLTVLSKNSQKRRRRSSKFSI